MWLVLSALAAIGFLVYGAMVQSTPSAFDRPEAQTPTPPRNPWIAVRPL